MVELNSPKEKTFDGKITRNDVRQFLLEYTVKNGKYISFELSSSGLLMHFFINREHNLQTTDDAMKKFPPGYQALKEEVFEYLEKSFFSVVKKIDFTEFAIEKQVSQLNTPRENFCAKIEMEVEKEFIEEKLNWANSFFFEERGYSPSSDVLNNYFDLMMQFIDEKGLMAKF